MPPPCSMSFTDLGDVWYHGNLQKSRDDDDDTTSLPSYALAIEIEKLSGCVTLEQNQNVTGDVTIDHQNVTGDVTIDNHNIAEDVTIDNHNIVGDVTIDHPDVTGDVTIDNHNIAGDVTIDNHNIVGDVTIDHPDVTGDVTIDQEIVTGDVRTNQTSVTTDLGRDVTMDHISITNDAGDVMLSRNSIKDDKIIISIVDVGTSNQHHVSVMGAPRERHSSITGIPSSPPPEYDEFNQDGVREEILLTISKNLIRLSRHLK